MSLFISYSYTITKFTNFIFDNVHSTSSQNPSRTVSLTPGRVMESRCLCNVFCRWSPARSVLYSCVHVTTIRSLAHLQILISHHGKFRFSFSCWDSCKVLHQPSPGKPWNESFICIYTLLIKSIRLGCPVTQNMITETRDINVLLPLSNR